MEGSELQVQARRWRGLGVEDAHGRRGEREAQWGSWGEEDVDMRQRWRLWRRPGERERRWRGLGPEDAYGRRGEQEARCCSRGEGDADMGQLWRAWRRPVEWKRRWRGLGLEQAYVPRGERDARCCSRGEGDVDMGRRRRACRRPEERERRDRGPRGSWWRLGERERRKKAAELPGFGAPCGGGGGSAAVCGIGSKEASAGPGGAWRGTAWYWGGGGESPTLYGSAA